MKHNPKESINIITFVDEFLIKLNDQCVKHKVPKVYTVSIIDSTFNPTTEQVKAGEKTSKCKLIRLMIANTDTNERLTIFEANYIYSNSATLITSDYKRVLYRELLYNAFGSFAFVMENSVREAQIDKKKLDNSIDKFSAMEKPTNLNDEYKIPTI